MNHDLILILASTVYGTVGVGLLGALIWAGVLDGKDDQGTSPLGSTMAA